jgi:hypothetical protein
MANGFANYAKHLGPVATRITFSITETITTVWKRSAAVSFDLADYVTVAQRMRDFFKKYPEGSLQLDQPKIIEICGKTWAIGRAYAYRTPDDQLPGIGTAMEVIPGLTPYTRGSEIQNLETSCWGRALAAIGIGIENGVATADEVRSAKAREGVYKTTDSDSEDYYSKPTPRPTDRLNGPAARHYDSKPLTPKQMGLLSGKLRERGILDDALLGAINGLLMLDGRDTVTSTSEITNAGLDYLLDNLDKLKTVDQFIADMET